MGYSLNHKGYKCLDSNGKLYIFRDVIFDETTFPFAQTDQSSYSIHNSFSLSDSTPSASPPILTVPSQTHSHPILTVPIDRPINEVNLPYVPNVHSISPVTDVVVQDIVSCSNTNVNRMIGQPRVQGNTHVMTTRSKNGIAKPKVYITTVKEPETIELALQKDEWK